MAKAKKKITYMEPRRMRRTTTGIDDGGFFVEEKSPSYIKKKQYTLGYKSKVDNNELHPGIKISQHVVSKEFHDAFVKEAEKQWKEHSAVVEQDEEMTITEEY